MVALPGDALLELITAGTILPALIYGVDVMLYLAVRKRWSAGRARSTSGASSCRWRSARWSGRLFALFVLVAPAEALVPVVIVVGLLLAGRAVLRLPADLPPRGAGDRARRRQRLQALTER